MLDLEDLEEAVGILENIRDAGIVGDPNTSNISIEFNITNIEKNHFFNLINIISEAPNLFSAFSINLSNAHTVFSLRNEQIESGNIDEIDELDIQSDPLDCEEGFLYYRDENDLFSAAEKIYDFASNLEEEDNRYLTSKVIFDKEKLASSMLGTKLTANQRVGYNPVFWLSIERFNVWLSNTECREVTESVFNSDGIPIFLFNQNVDQVAEAIIISSLSEFQEMSVDTIESARDQYIQTNKQSRKITQWQGNLIPIHPEQIFPLHNLQDISNSEPLLLLSIFGAFAKKVKGHDGEFEFTYTLNPEYSPTANLDNVAGDLTSSEMDLLLNMYSEFKPNEDDSSFRDLWQRAISDECNPDPIEAIARNATSVQEVFKEYRSAAVSENFDDLSDVLDDTQSIMASITTRLSDAANDVSRQIQGLTFTLLGAVIANIFLVLRWGSKDLVPPFSIFVLTIIVGFYLPLVQGRIDDLDNTIEEINNDYNFYQKQIRRFNQDLFGPGLDGRMEAHEGLAKTQRDRAKTQIKLVFYVSMISWIGLTIWTGIAYKPGLLRTGSLLLSISILALISGKLPTSYGDSVQHTEHDYFRTWIVVLALVIAIFALISQLYIYFSPTIAENTVPQLPRFQNEIQQAVLILTVISSLNYEDTTNAVKVIYKRLSR